MARTLTGLTKRCRTGRLRGRKLAVPGLAGLLITALAPVLRAEGRQSLILPYSYPEPVIRETTRGLASVSLDGAVPWGRPGQPVLPVAIARVLIPGGADVLGVQAEPAEAAELELRQPLEYNRGIGLTGAGSTLDFPRDRAVYGSSRPFPAKLAELVTVQQLHGYRVAFVRICPFRYFPAEGTLRFIKRLHLRVELGPRPERRGDGTKQCPPEWAWPEVRELVDNPREGGTYPVYRHKARAGDFEYLIITPEAFREAFETLADHKAGRGLSVHIETVESILTGQPGEDAAAKLRNFIKLAYEEHGTRYVLLGGDTPRVPHRGCYGNMLNYYLDDQIPADLYFAALDGDWNADGDDVYGEPEDNPDLLPELAVGRIAASSLTEARQQIQKIIAYENSAPPFSALLLGEKLDDTTWGEDSTERAWQEMAGIPATRLYDRDQVWTAQTLLSRLNSNQVHLVNHSGHSSTCYALRLTCSQAGQLTNTVPFFLYSNGCYPGAFDSDCFAERITTGMPAGAFAVIMNSRYGWYHVSSDNASSDELGVEFMRQVFKLGHHRLGLALNRSKMEMAGFTGDGTYRWAYYALNLFGCPETELHWTVANPQLRVSFEYPRPGMGVQQHDAIPVEVSVHTTTGLAVTGAQVVVNGSGPGSPWQLVLRDDGAGPDRQAGDGLYTAYWTPLQTGTCSLEAVAEHGGWSTATAQLAVDILPFTRYRISTPVFNWIPMTGATNIAADWSYDGFMEIPLGFDFKFFGKVCPNVILSENGTVQLAGHYSGDPDPLPVPSWREPNALIGAFWTDLDLRSAGQLRYLVTGQAPARRFVAAWENVPHFENVGSTTFQVVLEEGTNRILVQYLDTLFGNPYCDLGLDAVAGIEDFSGRQGVVYSHRQPLLTGGLAVEYRPLPPGDLNGDGSADAADAVLLRNVLAGNTGLADMTGAVPQLCDFNNSGALEVADLLALLMMLAGS